MAKIFWSEKGEVNCEKHAPYRGSDTWIWERWSEITPEVIAEIDRAGTTFKAVCEVCGAEPSRIVKVA